MYKQTNEKGEAIKLTVMTMDAGSVLNMRYNKVIKSFVWCKVHGSESYIFTMETLFSQN